MSKFINPRTDFAFKKIFGSPQSKDILINFLDALLYEGKSVIQDLTILDPYQVPRIRGIKESYLDVKALLADGQTVIIEMQVLNVLGFKKRVLYNAAKSYSAQLEVGDDYALLNPVIALTITDFEMFSDSERVVSRYRLKEVNDLKDYSNDLELVFAELPKFRKEVSQLSTLADKWLYFLKEAERLKSVPPNLDQEPAIHDAFEVARQSHLTKEELDILERQSFFIQDNKNSIRLGVMQGKAEGRKEGLEEGDKQARIEIARSLKDKMSLSEIAAITGLTPEEIEEII
ncbi:MAG: Rpn family recombination-promoting nuclease/putative transposase [Phormidesmis sp.]